MTNVAARADTQDAFLDAAERLLIEVGYAGISTRRLAEEAGANHGLVHYYFGSMENLFVRVLERFTDRLIARQRAMYARHDMSGVEKWRTAMGYLESDLAAGYPKIWLELQALGWNRPDIAERVAAVNREWRDVLTDAFDRMLDEYDVDRDELPLPGLVSLVMTFNEGVMVERLSGISAGHRELMDMVEHWLGSLEEAKR
ncbi:MAG TPA: TetR/AcrR family transcriptional regulator [Solirubrobacteraceae bacterium]|nr:TetR/AcrR family transcriptional regulator [Solirubrobacteraceae bacterium]